MIEGRAGPCDEGGSLLNFLSASLTTPRCVLALRGREGCDSLVKLEEKENDDVVGSMNWKGMLQHNTSNLLWVQTRPERQSRIMYVCPDVSWNVKIKETT